MHVRALVRAAALGLAGLPTVLNPGAAHAGISYSLQSRDLGAELSGSLQYKSAPAGFAPYTDSIHLTDQLTPGAFADANQTSSLNSLSITGTGSAQVSYPTFQPPTWATSTIDLTFTFTASPLSAFIIFNISGLYSSYSLTGPGGLALSRTLAPGLYSKGYTARALSGTYHLTAEAVTSAPYSIGSLSSWNLGLRFVVFDKAPRHSEPPLGRLSPTPGPFAALAMMVVIAPRRRTSGARGPEIA